MKNIKLNTKRMKIKFSYLSITKFIFTLVIAVLMYLPFSLFAQSGNENLFEYKNENEAVLKMEHSNKLQKIKNNKLNKTVQLIKFGNIQNIAKLNNGALPIKLPGVNKVIVAKRLI